jgi:hypothetical protein
MLNGTIRPINVNGQATVTFPSVSVQIQFPATSSLMSFDVENCATASLGIGHLRIRITAVAIGLVKLSQFVLFITNIQSNGLIVLDDPSSSIKV